jgi:hypothetical protein
MFSNSSLSQTATTIVFIDSSLSDYQTLQTAVVEGVETVILSPNQNGIEEITDFLRQHTKITTIHIVSHGSPGCLYLGNGQLNLDNISKYADLLPHWQSQNILLYGCNVAAGDAGEEFIRKLHEITNATISASATKTGNAALGGNWELEVNIPENDGTSLVFRADTLNTYQGVFAPTLVGEWDFLSYATAVTVVGNYAYAVGDRLEIIDISNPSQPVVKGSYKISGGQGVQIVGNYAYVAGGSGLKIIDISNPLTPTLKGNYYTFDAEGVQVIGNYAYIAASVSGLKIIDISNPLTPTLKGNYDTSGITYDVQVIGNYAYVANSYSGLQIIDISNPLTPTLKGNYDTSGNAYGVQVVGNYAYVADGDSGLQIIDISNPLTPTLKGNYDASVYGYAQGVQVVGNYAYVVDSYSGLEIIDISNPLTPTLKGNYDTYGSGQGVQVVGNYAYVADGYPGLQIIDISNPLTPTLKGNYAASSSAQGVQVVGNYAYVADGGLGLQIIDISNPLTPTLKGNYDTSGRAWGVQVVGNYAYVADSYSGLQIIDISNPLAPTLKGNYDTSGRAWGVQVVGNYAYVADDYSGLQIIDISSPLTPTLKGNYNTSGSAVDVQVVGNYAYVADFGSAQGLQIIDISNPLTPILKGHYDNSSRATGVQIVGNYAYVADNDSGLQIIDISNPLTPTLKGNYDTSGGAYSVQVVGNYAYVGLAQGGLKIIDVNEFTNPPINQAPTNLTLSNSNIAENQAINTVVGNFTTTDPDTGNTFTYSLIAGTGATDNSLFTITNNQLKTNGVFDYETKNSYSIRVKTTDQGGLSFEKQLTVGITNVNEAPTDITLSNNLLSVAENQSIGTVIGNLITIDPDGGNTFTYSLVTGAGDTDNALFSTTNSQLKTNAVFDYETRNSYNIRVRSSKQDGLSYEKQLNITITNLNETPINLTLSNNNISENEVIGTVIGLFNSTDPDTSNSFTYSLVSGTGATDNALFAIAGNQLKTNTVFDYETKNSYSIRVRTTDQGGLSYEKQLTIAVTDVNEAPSNLTISNDIISENQAIGTVVGTLNSTDPDTNSNFTYSLVTGPGATDNALFAIAGNQLKTNAILDFETKSNYSIRVRTTEQSGLSYEKQLNITVTDINEAPYSLSLSNSSITQNQPIGAVIGTLSSYDPDAGNTFTYSLVTGTGDSDNALFSLVGNQLKTNAVLDIETQNSYSIRVRTTDQSGLSYERRLIIAKPVPSLDLSNNENPVTATVSENQIIGTVVSTLNTVDPDANNTFTYSLVTGTGSTDNALFTIDENLLKTNTVFNFEAQNSYNIRVRTTDQGGLSYEKQIIVAVTNLNETPTNLTLSNSTVAENQVIGTVVGNLTSTDPDTGNTFTYSLVTGTGATDNSLFTISNNQLTTNSVFDYETKNSYSIRVRTTDQGGLSFEKQLTIGVTDVNETPNNLTLSNSTVTENQVIGTVVGNLTTTDPDTGNTFTYSLVAGTGATDNSVFTISNNQLKTNSVFDYETKNSYSVRVKTTDQGGLSYEKQLTIGVNDLNVITGNPLINNGRTPIVGTAGSEYIIGGPGAKTLTGGAGNDFFVFTDLRDVGQRITDFTVGTDKIVLTQLISSINYIGTDPIADQYMRFVAGTGSNTGSTFLQIDRDGILGSAIFKNFLQVDNITTTQLNNLNNFVF